MRVVASRTMLAPKDLNRMLAQPRGTLAREFAEHEITANTIGPGTIDVERDAFQKTKGLRPAQPLRRLGKPQEVVSLMVYLASEDAGFITGQTYLVNGGMYFH